MGMHRNWEFHLPAETSAERVTELLTALRERALQLPFEEVTGIEDITEIIAHPSGDSWFSIRDYVAQWVKVISKPDEEDSRIGDLNTAVGFGIYPGKRCEDRRCVQRCDAKGARGGGAIFEHPEFERLEMEKGSRPDSD
jgi:hypothetical protein